MNYNLARYTAYLFNLQPRRRISPALYIFSMASLKIIVVSLVLFLFLGDGARTYIITGGAFLWVRSYMRSKMSFRALNSIWNPLDPDGALPIISYINKKKEYYLKSRIKILRGVEFE